MLKCTAAGGDADLFSFKLLEILNPRLGDQIESGFGGDDRYKFYGYASRRGG